MKLRCAIFDFDGTLFDSMYVWDTLGETYLKVIGVVPREGMRQEVKPLSLYEFGVYLQKEYGVEKTPETIIEEINVITDSAYANDIQPKAGAIPFLKALKAANVSLCVATASVRSHIESALKRCDMLSLFDHVLTCDELGHGKGEPFIYRTAMELCGADRQSTLVFEDAWHAAKTVHADGFPLAVIEDDSSSNHKQELTDIADIYMKDFEDTQDLQKFLSRD